MSILNPDVLVTVTDPNGKTLKGKVTGDFAVMAGLEHTIKLCKNLSSKSCYWETRKRLSSKPSQLKVINGAEYYLVFDSDGDLAVRRTSEPNRADYVLAEMKPEDGFVMTQGSKIECESKF